MSGSESSSIPAGDRLSVERLKDAIGDAVVGREILVLEETKSTNDFLLQMTAPQVPEGLVVFAEHQTAGRGQHGRRWESAPGQSLWFSILLRPRLPVHESARLTDWAAHSIARVVTRLVRAQVTVKVPNDVYLADRKVAGVLVEMRAQGKDYIAIVGIGLNVNQSEFPPEIARVATSLRMSEGRTFDRNVVGAQLLRDLDRTYRSTFPDAPAKKESAS